MKTEVFQIRLSATDKDKLKTLAEENEMTMSEWIVNQIRINHKEKTTMKFSYKITNKTILIIDEEQNQYHIVIDPQDYHDYTAEENINDLKDKINDFFNGKADAECMSTLMIDILPLINSISK